MPLKLLKCLTARSSLQTKWRARHGSSDWTFGYARKAVSQWDDKHADPPTRNAHFRCVSFVSSAAERKPELTMILLLIFYWFCGKSSVVVARRHCCMLVLFSCIGPNRKIMTNLPIYRSRYLQFTGIYSVLFCLRLSAFTFDVKLWSCLIYGWYAE